MVFAKTGHGGKYPYFLVTKKMFYLCDSSAYCFDNGDARGVIGVNYDGNKVLGDRGNVCRTLDTKSFNLF